MSESGIRNVRALVMVNPTRTVLGAPLSAVSTPQALPMKSGNKDIEGGKYERENFKGKIITMPTTLQKLTDELQNIAKQVDDLIAKSTGERLGFALIIFTDNVVSHVSNGEPSVTSHALQKLLKHWEEEKLPTIRPDKLS